MVGIQSVDPFVDIAPCGTGSAANGLKWDVEWANATEEIDDGQCCHGEAHDSSASARKTDGDGSNRIVLIEWNSVVTVSSMINTATGFETAKDRHSNSSGRSNSESSIPSVLVKSI
jgi:hypothetical protein